MPSTPAGYAAQMRRAATLTRYYLQVPPGDVLDDWPDDRIRVELEKRLGLGGASPLAGVQFVERDFVDLRVRMRDSMQLGRLFLAGDAAHLITPAGGKGMNLAVQDAIELAAGLCERFGRPGRAERLERYSATRGRPSAGAGVLELAALSAASGIGRTEWLFLGRR